MEDPFDHPDFSDDFLSELESIFVRPETAEESALSDQVATGLEHWKEYCDVDSSHVTVGFATSMAWRKAKAEFEVLRKMFKEKTGSEQPSLAQLINFMFGQDSLLFKCFSEAKVITDNKVFMRFVATFAQSAAYKTSTKDMFSQGSRLNLDGLMEEKEYRNIWTVVSGEGLPPIDKRKQTRTPAGIVPFWMKVETALNTFCTQYIAKSVEEPLVIVDDDKCHFARGRQRYSYGLKLVRHTKDNRNGNNIHTAVLATSQMILQVAYERDTGDTTETCTKRIYHDAFTPMAPAGQLGNMSRVSTAKDRGYWGKDLLENTVMPSGMKIEASTVKRMPCIPMTFNQKMNAADQRTLIPHHGAKTQFIQRALIKNRPLYNVCYRNGTGNCTLGLTTKARYGAKPVWEMVLARPHDIGWWQEQQDADGSAEGNNAEWALKKLGRCFKTLLPDNNDNHHECVLEELAKLDIQALTTTQASQEWFLLRKFSLTSSTSDAVVRLFTGDEDMLKHSRSWKLIKDLLKGVWEEAQPIPDEGQQDAATGGSGDEEADQDSRQRPTDEASEMEEPSLKNLLDPSDGDRLANSLKHRIDFKENPPSIAYVRSILTELGHNLSKRRNQVSAEQQDLSNFRDWLNCVRQLRPFYFKPKAELDRIANLLKIQEQARERENAKSKDVVRSVISQYFTDNPGAEMPAIIQNRSPQAALDQRQKVLLTILKSSHLKPLAGKIKSDAKRGHELEEQVILNCIKDHKNDTVRGVQIPQLKSACKAGLVAKRSMPYFKDSIDGIGLISGDEIVGIEVKSRVKASTSEEEDEHLQQIWELLHAESRTDADNQRKYFQINADSNDFAKVIRKSHELMQLLHHAACYGLEKMLFLAGDDVGKVIFGVFIKIPERIRRAYEDVCKDIYDNFLSFAYDESIPEEVKSNLSEILPHVKVDGVALDEHSFFMEVATYKDASRLSFPLPQIIRIIPLIFAIWNAIKGGSDSITKMLWHCAYSTPTDDNQSNATGRLLMLHFVLLLKMWQLSTAKEDLNKYDSLEQYRNAANKRSTFQGTLMATVEEMIKQAQTAEISSTAPIAQVVSSLKRKTRSEAAVSAIDIGPSVRTGKTPKRRKLERLDSLQMLQEQGGQLGVAERIMVDRLRSCTGIPALPEGGTKKTCVFCRARTPNYCPRCESYICLKQSENFKKMEGIACTVLIKGDAYHNCCYLEHHKQAIEQDLSPRSSD